MCLHGHDSHIRTVEETCYSFKFHCLIVDMKSGRPNKCVHQPSLRTWCCYRKQSFKLWEGTFRKFFCETQVFREQQSGKVCVRKLRHKHI